MGKEGSYRIKQDCQEDGVNSLEMVSELPGKGLARQSQEQNKGLHEECVWDGMFGEGLWLLLWVKGGGIFRIGMSHLAVGDPRYCTEHVPWKR